MSKVITMALAAVAAIMLTLTMSGCTHVVVIGDPPCSQPRVMCDSCCRQHDGMCKQNSVGDNCVMTPKTPSGAPGDVLPPRNDIEFK